MTRQQLALLSVGLAALVGLLLFPPWLAITNWADGHFDVDECAHHFLLAPPRAPAILPELQARAEARRRAGAGLYRGPDCYVIDTTRLILPISILCAVTLSGLVILRRRG